MSDRNFCGSITTMEGVGCGPHRMRALTVWTALTNSPNRTHVAERTVRTAGMDGAENVCASTVAVACKSLSSRGGSSSLATCAISAGSLNVRLAQDKSDYSTKITTIGLANGGAFYAPAATLRSACLRTMRRCSRKRSITSIIRLGLCCSMTNPSSLDELNSQANSYAGGAS